MYAYGKNVRDITDRFEETVKRALKKYPDALNLITALDAKSSVTFKHSVTVALEFYFQAAGKMSGEELESWTLGALLHDIGKLRTPVSVLHADKPLEGGEVEEMMAHSIQSYECLQGADVPREVFAAAIGHHMVSSALHREGFEGAEYSKGTWKNTFEEGYIRSVIEKSMSWMTERDVDHLDTIALTDVCEALRSSVRSYKQELHWGSKDELGTVDYFINSDALAGKLNPAVAENIHEFGFQRMFDVFMNLGMETRVREMISKMGLERSFELSNDKMAEIIHNPALGIEFAVPVVDDNGDRAFLIRQGGEHDDCLLIRANEEGLPDVFSKPVKISRKDAELKYHTGAKKEPFEIGAKQAQYEK